LENISNTQPRDAVDVIHALQADIKQQYLRRGFGGQSGEALRTGEAFAAVQGK
jgi:hypothetical protein